MKKEKKIYVAPQCEELAVVCEGMIALSPEFTGWDDDHWVSP